MSSDEASEDGGAESSDVSAPTGADDALAASASAEESDTTLKMLPPHKIQGRRPPPKRVVRSRASPKAQEGGGQSSARARSECYLCNRTAAYIANTSSSDTPLPTARTHTHTHTRHAPRTPSSTAQGSKLVVAAKGKVGEAKADICEDCFGGAKDAFSLTDWGTIYKEIKSDREFKEIARNASLVKRGEKERDFNTAGVSSTVEVGMRCVRYLKFDTEASFRAENDGFTLDDIRAPRVTIQDERSHKVSGFASEHPVLPGSAT